jgi:hypothetical protein
MLGLIEAVEGPDVDSGRETPPAGETLYKRLRIRDGERDADRSQLAS